MITVTTPRLTRRRPRAFPEWRQLQDWGKLPDREAFVPGYVLRTAREIAGLTQSQLAAKMGVTQQAIARAENWNSNPTVGLMNRWARECGRRLELRLLGKA